jgi:hypothetical protein
MILLSIGIVMGLLVAAQLGSALRDLYLHWRGK